MNDTPWTIRERCSVNWETMRGDDRRRFCEHCQRHVYNVSAMTHAEREVFAHPDNRHECVFYSQRANGEIADLSLFARLRQWFPVLRLICWSTFIGLLPFILTGCPGMRQPRGEIRLLPQAPPPTSEQSSNQVNNAAAPKPPEHS